MNMEYDAEMISSAKVFANKYQATEHAAYMVACYWLESTDKILARGDVPCKLSKCGLTLAKDEMDRDIYGRYRRHMDTIVIRTRAMQFALAKLYTGQFPKVRKHFEVSPQDSDSEKMAKLSLRQIGESE